MKNLLAKDILWYKIKDILWYYILWYNLMFHGDIISYSLRLVAKYSMSPINLTFPYTANAKSNFPVNSLERFTENKKVTTFWAWKPSENENIWASSKLYWFSLTLLVLKTLLVFFQGHSRITGLHGKGEGISLTPHYHFHPLHRHFIASSRTRTGNLYFQSASH